MKKDLILTILLPFAYMLSYADDAPICNLHGGTVKPIENVDIQLYSETIDIILKADHYLVEVNYKFINKGKSQEVKMGFPSSSKEYITSVYDFKAFENGRQLNITTEKTDWSYEPANGMSCQYIGNPIDQFECHTVIFEENEIKNIKNTYTALYDPSYRGESVTSFQYILKTGAFWKDNIHSAIVRVNTKDAPLHFDLDNGCNLNGEKISLNGFSKKFIDFEPNFDLVFGIKFKTELVAIKATSNLKSSGNISYGINNLMDNDISTAWVEGKEDSGIGSVIHFFRAKESDKKIKAIRVVNGYAKNASTFKNNNRVACIKVVASYELDTEYWDSFSEGIRDYFDGRIGIKHEYIFSLKDISTEQVLDFEYPLKANRLSIEILDVYKGQLYDDTALSEIRIFEE